MPQMRTRKSAALAIALAGLLAACAIALAACGGSQEATTDTAAEPSGIAIGQAATIGDSGLSVTVESAGEGRFDMNGETTYQLTVTYVNEGSEPVAFSESDWQLIDAEGASTDVLATFFYDPPKTLGSGELAPGESVTDDVYFTPPEPAVVGVVFSFNGENAAEWVVE